MGSCFMPNRQPHNDAPSSDTNKPNSELAPKQMPISVGDAVVCLNNVSIRPGTLAATIEELELCLWFRENELTDTSNKSEHRAAWQLVKQHTEAIEAKWGQFEEEASRYECFGHNDLYPFREKLFGWIKDALAILMNVGRHNRESRRLFDARLADKLLRLQAASDAESHAVSDRQRELVFEAVALEERLEQARQAKRDQEGERRATGPTFQIDRELIDQVGEWATPKQLQEACGVHPSWLSRHYAAIPKGYKKFTRREIKDPGTKKVQQQYNIKQIFPKLKAHLDSKQ